jgi:hypothetical protein
VIEERDFLFPVPFTARESTSMVSSTGPLRIERPSGAGLALEIDLSSALSVAFETLGEDTTIIIKKIKLD